MRQVFKKKSPIAPLGPLQEKKKAGCKSQSQFGSENTPASIEANQFIVVFQQLVRNCNSINFNIKNTQFSKLAKSLTTTVPTIDWKCEKFKLFEVFFQTSLKILSPLTEDDKINYFQYLTAKDALQTFETIKSRTRGILGEMLAILRWKNVKFQLMATQKKTKIPQICIQPIKPEASGFFVELQNLADDAIGNAANAVIEQFISTELPPHLKKSLNHANSEIGKYEQIATHLEQELELNGLEASDELQINIATQHTTED